MLKITFQAGAFLAVALAAPEATPEASLEVEVTVEAQEKIEIRC